MKHKNFDKVMPYSYFLVRISDGKKYVGVRYANVKNNLTPSEDFGKVYFTSGKLKREFRKNPQNFKFTLKYTFDTIEEMFDWERRITLRIYKHESWANNGWCTNFGDNPEIGKLISEGKKKINKDGITSIKVGASKLVEWIYSTPEGESYRKELSERKKKYWETLTDTEKKEVISKRKENMDFYDSAKKAAITRSVVGDDGLTCHQRSAMKAAETRSKMGLNSKIGSDRNKKFNKMLGEMSEEDFKSYCEGRSNRFVNACKTRRLKYKAQTEVTTLF